jgi:hypothetical protein
MARALSDGSVAQMGWVTANHIAADTESACADSIGPAQRGRYSLELPDGVASGSSLAFRRQADPWTQPSL